MEGGRGTRLLPSFGTAAPSLDCPGRGVKGVVLSEAQPGALDLGQTGEYFAEYHDRCGEHQYLQRLAEGRSAKIHKGMSSPEVGHTVGDGSTCGKVLTNFKQHL